MGELSLRRRQPLSNGCMLSQPGADAGCAGEEEEKGKNKLECTAGGQECVALFLASLVVIPCLYFPGLFGSS